MKPHAGRTQDERVAARKGKKLPSLEQTGGRMALEGTQPDESHSSGELSEAGKEVWRKGAGMDGGGKTSDITAETPPGGARIVGKGNESAVGPGPDVMAASTFEGDKILSTDGDEVGKVKEIMLDVKGGRLAYVVMSSGGFLGIGDKLLAVPWSALTVDTTRKCFLLALSSERVKNAPGFDKDHWPSMADRTWATSIHQHFGREPYWHGLGTDDEYERTAGAGAEDLDPDAPEAGGVKL